MLFVFAVAILCGGRSELDQPVEQRKANEGKKIELYETFYSGGESEINYVK